MGQPLELRLIKGEDLDTIFQWLIRNAERSGFRPYYHEPWLAVFRAELKM